MNPTRPISSKTITGPASRAPIAGSSAATGPAAATDAATAEPGASQVDGSPAAFAHAEVRRLDTAKLASLKDEVQAGHYHVSAEQLASRIVDDALGPETT